jgi:tRNA dimethylallyltransferase
MTDMRPILIAGPTASGKSDLALRLAEQLGGVVINADSMQVYRALRVLTARPSVEDEARAPHALYGFVPGKESYSAGRYVGDVVSVLAEAREQGRRPIIVGGTGLYFKALTDGLSPIPQIPDDIRAQWRARALDGTSAALHAELAQQDPEMGKRLAPGDTQRIVRALEVLDATGRSLAEWQLAPREPVLALEDTLPLYVDIDRDELTRRIDTRFERMVEAGALDEAMQLGALHLDPTLPLMTAHGVRPLLAHLDGKASLGQAIAASTLETRQYAKRQLTWARGNMIAWRRICAQQTKTIGEILASFVPSSH